jgi:ATP-binding cassette, subfamily D (ALD), member 4
VPVSIGLADYTGSILSYIILAIPIFGGMYDDLTPVELSALISQVSDRRSNVLYSSCVAKFADICRELVDYHLIVVIGQQCYAERHLLKA